MELTKAAIRRWARGRGRGDSGSVTPVFALMLVPLIGGLGMATEMANGYLTQRAMQNAADSAAIAAATNGTTTACTTAGDFCYEAKAAAARLGYTNGVNNVTVTPAHLTTTCPSPVTSCYKVTISKTLTVSLLRLVGSSGTQTVRAASIASASAPVNYCSIALGTGKGAFTINGGPNVNLAGCDLFSDGDLKCNGSNADTGVAYGEAVGNSSCGANQLSKQAAMSDPFSGLSKNIPTNPCTSYAGGTISSSTSFSSPILLCGNYKLTSDVHITSSGSEIVIYNGSLDLNGYTLSTSGNGSATIIFSGTGAAAQYPIDTSSKTTGTIDIAAPTSGTFAGVAIMQDSSLPDNSGSLDMTYTGNSPTLDVQGLIYMPNGNFTVKGAINLHTGGLSCIGVIAQTILVSGQGSIFNNDAVGVTAACPAAGLDLPTVAGAKSRLALVQ